MADLIQKYSTADVTRDQMGQVIENEMTLAKNSRRTFERRWYDNNFFDDGFHFRFLSRQQNKIVDLSDRATLYNPMRAIPKASRQVRGMANLMLGRDPHPVVYPEKLDMGKFPPIQGQDPQTGQPVMQQNPQYKQAMDASKDIAKKSGYWLEDVFKKIELQMLLAQMIILTGKHSISFMEIWPDAVKERVNAQVFDAFDIYLNGQLTSIYDNPFIIKGVPQIIAKIKADERFDPYQVEKINADNRQASSEIKEAYQRAKFGGETNPDSAATVILKEAFSKEYLNGDNESRIKAQENGEEILKGKNHGDQVIRQTFVAGNIWLRDEYLNLPDYPLVDFRMEPGPTYQVPLIERFIPANKSLDLVSSRVERYTHTMVTGSWSKRQGEQFNIDNTPGGQIIEYAGQPPVQNQIAPIPAFVFNYMNFLNSIIEEQGVTTTTLGKLPSGVRANAAIESLKESEYANLKIPLDQLKSTVTRIAEKCLDIADNHFVSPQTVYYVEKGEPAYFDVIGGSNLTKRQKLKVNTPEGVVPLKKDYLVDIEIENGSAFTKEGGRQVAMDLVKELYPFYKDGLIPPETLKTILENVLESFQFSGVGEFMATFEESPAQLTDQQKQSMKVAIMEVMADLQQHGVLPTSEQRVQEGKLATAQALKDTGVAGKQPEAPKGPSESVSFKDLPPEGKVQLAAQAGIQLDANQIRADEMQQQQQDQQMADRQMAVKEKQVQQKGQTNATNGKPQS